MSELTKLKFKIDMVLKTLFLMDKRLTLVEEHLKKRAPKTEFYNTQLWLELLVQDIDLN